MTPERWRQIHGIFEQAAQCPAGERQRYLDQVRSEDATLAAEAADLLAHDARAFAEGFLSAACPVNVKAGLSLSAGADRLIGRRIGPFEIQQHIASGGMGDVYRAVRVEDYRNTVALKVIRNGLAGPELCERFRNERQVLARLSHPNVVRLLHGGTTEEGLLYFAMEYIDGMPLDHWCTQRQPTLRERLLLLITVARAVHYAHEQGVIHRDLKPSNVLVAADGTPKISDFGLAKYFDSAGTFDGGSQTRTGVILGSPSYLAPEQAGGSSRGIGPATDVYALGAILYELLTGRPPFQGVTLLDTLDQVRSAEPLSPRRCSPKLSRDLETICLKALAKNPAGRYATAEEFAADLERFLLGRPVQARPVGRLVKAARWCRGHPAIAGLVAVVLLVAALGFAGVVWQWRKAEAHLVEVGRQRDRAQAYARQAHQAINDFVKVSQRPLLKRSDQNAMRQQIWQTGLKYYRDFLEQDDNSPSLDNTAWRADTASAYSNLGHLLRETGSPTEAAATYERACALWERLVEDDPQTASHRLALARALYFLSVMQMEEKRSDEALKSYRRVIQLFTDLERRQALADADWNCLLASCLRLGQRLEVRGRVTEAADCYERACARAEKDLSERPAYFSFQRLATFYYSLMWLEQKRDRLDKALEVYRRGVHVLEPFTDRTPLSVEPTLALAYHHHTLGSLHRRAGRHEQALAAYRESQRLLANVLQRDSAHFEARRLQAQTHYHICNALSALSRSQEASEACRQAYALTGPLLSERPLHFSHRNLHGDVCFWLGKLQGEAGRRTEAITAFREAAEQFDQLAKNKPAQPKWRAMQGTCLHSAASQLVELNRVVEATDYFRRAAALRDSACQDAPDNLSWHDDAAGTWHRLGELQERLEHADEALTAYQHAIAHLRAAATKEPKHQRRLREFLQDETRLLKKLGRDEEAAAVMAQYNSISGASLP